MKRFAKISLALLLVTLAGCGRSPSGLLRQGQSPVYDYPLYVSEGAPGKVWRYERDRSRTLVASGLSDPRGIATDKFNNLYVVEQGLGRVLKINTNTLVSTVVRDGLGLPSVVAVDSLGDAFVAQDTSKNIIRVSDGDVFATFTSRPSALAFGVNDMPIIGLFDSSTVLWGVDGPSDTVTEPVGISTDATGRVYVAEGSASGARVFRYHQREASGKTEVADNLSGLGGMIVDSVGNIYAVEQGASRVIVITFDGQLFTWTSDTIDPQYISFTQY